MIPSVLKLIIHIRSTCTIFSTDLSYYWNYSASLAANTFPEQCDDWGRQLTIAQLFQCKVSWFLGQAAADCGTPSAFFLCAFLSNEHACWWLLNDQPLCLDVLFFQFFIWARMLNPIRRCTVCDRPCSPTIMSNV